MLLNLEPVSESEHFQYLTGIFDCHNKTRAMHILSDVFIYFKVLLQKGCSQK